MQKFILLVDNDAIRGKRIKDELEQSDPNNTCVVWAKNTDELELQLESEICFGMIVINKLAPTETIEALSLLKKFRELYPELALIIGDSDLRRVINLSCYLSDTDVLTSQLILEKYPF